MYVHVLIIITNKLYEHLDLLFAYLLILRVQLHYIPSQYHTWGTAER